LRGRSVFQEFGGAVENPLWKSANAMEDFVPHKKLRLKVLGCS
jgi:hypothetical protein